MLIISPWIMPQVALIDPLLTLKMPKHITAATGLDALTHAIEAYVSRKAQPMTDILALSAIRLLAKHLPVAFDEPSNLEARAATLFGALQAGMAFSNASVALVHGMSRPIGALFHVPHGVSNAALLGVVTEFSLSGNYARYADVAQALGVTPSGDQQKTAEMGAKKVRELIQRLEIPGLARLGVTREKLDPLVRKMADDAIASGSPANNPRLATPEEIIDLYYAAI
jgi:alcohol dehydrogenase